MSIKRRNTTSFRFQIWVFQRKNYLQRQNDGTGPVGDAHPHPQAGELGISHRPDGWVYQSEEVAAMRGEAYIKDEKGGYVYTEGVPAKAFLYNALTASEDAILESLGGAVEEVFVK